MSRRERSYLYFPDPHGRARPVRRSRLRRAGIVVGATVVALGVLTGGAAVVAPAVGLDPTTVPRHLGLAPGAGQDGETDPSHYVALGDSFTAGPFIPPQRGEPRGCLRSENNYPNMVAERLKVGKVTDVSCSGATTKRMTGKQEPRLGGTNPPQFDALESDTTLVTISIGGNDFGFGGIAQTCMNVASDDPEGAPCEEAYFKNGEDELEGRIPRTGDQLAATLAGIRERSPMAKVAVVGYPQLLPEEGTCYPSVPFADGDVAYLDGHETSLNAELKRITEEAGMIFVDNSEPGHDACATSKDRWVEGMVPDKPTAPIHPNEKAMEAMTDNLLNALARTEGARG